MSLKLKILIIVAVQTLVLCAMVGGKQWTLNTGTEVVLETAPIDPRSLFRGDYVRLNYKISTLRAEKFANVTEFRTHDPIYVVLKKGDPYWHAESIHKDWPDTLKDDQVVIRGEVQIVAPFWNRRTRKIEPIKQFQVRYGIENYFVPEGEGRELERPKPGEKISMLLAVDSCGRAGIKAVLVNGKPRYVETLF